MLKATIFCILFSFAYGSTAQESSPASPSPTPAPAKITAKLLEEYFRAGNYQAVATYGPSFRGPKRLKAKANYFTGLALNRLGQFQEAPRYLSKAILAKVEYKDAYFELGQSYYANNEMQKSARAFLESIKQKFNVPTSMYYIAHIAQILEKWKTAKKYYKKITKDKTADPKIRQISRFQLGEVFLSYVQEKKEDQQRTYVKKFVLPQFEKAIDIDPRSGLAREILKRKGEVEKQFGLNPSFLVNGAASPTKFNASFSQKFKYDSNITYTNELPTQQGTLKDSFITNSTFTTSYNYVYDQKYVITPSLNITNTDHNDDVNSSVYQNDNYAITGSAKIDKPYTFDKKPGSYGYTFSYLYSARDRLSQQEKIFAGRTLTHAFSYSIPYFKLGPTTLSLSHANFSAYQETLDSTTNTLSLTQIMLFPNLTMLIFFASHSDISVEDSSNSTASTVFRADYLFLNLLATYTFQVGLGYTLTDTKEQSDSRGTEVTLAPSLKVTKKINNNTSFSLNYAYTDKTSESESFAYEKNVTTFEFRYKF